jgi:hypothetical protein
MPGGIVASSRIRKMERHDQLFVLLAEYRHLLTVESMSEQLMMRL